MEMVIRMSSEWRHSLMVLAAAGSLIVFQSCEHFGGFVDAENQRPVASEAKPRKDTRSSSKSTSRAKSKAAGQNALAAGTGAGTRSTEVNQSLLLAESSNAPLCVRDVEPRSSNFVTWIEAQPAQPKRLLLQSRPVASSSGASPRTVKVSKQLVLQNPADTQLSRMVFVVTESLNVRQAPFVQSPVIGTLKRGSSFKVTVVNGWAKLGDGQFVLAKYLSAKAPLADVKPKRGRHLASR